MLGGVYDRKVVVELVSCISKGTEVSRILLVISNYSVNIYIYIYIDIYTYIYIYIYMYKVVRR